LVERLYLRDLVTFKTLELTFEQGLVVFSGPSGAGKSVLISAILAAFGYPVRSHAALCEVTVNKPAKLQHEAYELGEEVVLRTLKKEKLRYFIDAQGIPKKSLSVLFSPYIRYLSARDQSGMDSAALIGMIDRYLAGSDKAFRKLRKEYKKRFATYRQKAAQLEKMKADEASLAERMEFVRYEIEKIEHIDPKPEEEEELLRVKRQLSRIDKVKAALDAASGIFSFEQHVEEVYRLLEKESSVFSEAMNQLRADFEESEALADELAEVDVEEVLERLGALTSLKNRYGSIEEALVYKAQKQKELDAYTHVGQDKSMLEQFLQVEYAELMILAQRISSARRQTAKALEAILREYLGSLKLPPLTFLFDTVALGEDGVDAVGIHLNGSGVDTLSGGEFNRVRLALMAAALPQDGKRAEGVLVLDEIDANVSGDESIAIAKMIEKLASVYQVFAISHQPHLASRAHQHILVTKEAEESGAKILDEAERIAEIARIVGGEKPNAQALAFARELRDAQGQ
jgi:DNA repair protein RecN (Recombination protein N)